MGAFDGLNFYQSMPRTSNEIHCSMDENKQPASWYVSWLGRVDGLGFTGKHFDTKEEADEAFNEKQAQGLLPAKWY